MESQKLLVIKTDPQKNGIAIREPPIHTQDLIIGLPLPNLSATIPPPSDEIIPPKILMREYKIANYAL